MQYFLDTIETIPEGNGFSHFGALHLIWLFAGALLIVLNCLWYRRMHVAQKKVWQRVVAVLILLDELFKMAMLTIGDRYNFTYLPLHLCSINIFVIAVHAWKPSDLVSGFLYTVCVPGAISALLFPTWTSLPLLNFMHLHSFTIHILLAMYPIVMVVSGDWKPYLRRLPRYFLLLVAMAIPVCVINLILDTNFMFLMEAEEGNPLYYFESLWGNHLWGFPVLISVVLVVMYIPIEVLRYFRRKNRKLQE